MIRSSGYTYIEGPTYEFFEGGGGGSGQEFIKGGFRVLEKASS